MGHAHPVQYRAKNLAGACHGFLRKFLELIVHRTAVLTVQIHLPPPASPLSLVPSRTTGSEPGTRRRYRARRLCDAPLHVARGRFVAPFPGPAIAGPGS